MPIATSFFFCYSEGVIFAVHHEQFEGSMATLLNLIEREQLKITEISLARVADDFIAHIRALASRSDPEELAEFVAVAAELMLIKSHTLLPDVVTEQGEREEPVGELERRLQEYQRLRVWAEELKAIARAGRRILMREVYASVEPFFYPPSGVTPAALEEACTALLATIPKSERLREEKIGRIISLEERIGEIRSLLGVASETLLSELLPMSGREREELIVSFLGILELVRAEFLEVRQDNPFEDITMRRRAAS